VSLRRFFAAVEPFLQGAVGVDAFLSQAGPSPSPEEDLAFYPSLVAFDQQRILAELCPMVRRLVDQTDGLEWRSLVREFVAAVPPAHWSVPGVGEQLADWLATRREAHPDQPVALEALADLYWSRFTVRTAPDNEGPGIGQRVLLRHYQVDVLGHERHLRDEGPPPDDRPRTLIVFRHWDTLGVRNQVARLSSLAVLAQLAGHTLAGPLAALPAAELEQESARLIARGVLPG